MAVNIADALDYLHNDSGTSIIHCDLKPTNILLNNDMDARLGDFGIARLYLNSLSTSIGDSNSFSSIIPKGTIGYIAPEYAGGGCASTCGDVYSLNSTSRDADRQRPTDSIFENRLNIVNFVERSFQIRYYMLLMLISKENARTSLKRWRQKMLPSDACCLFYQ